jgi:hypothetical protein
MTLETWGAALGAGLASAGMVVAGARSWLAKPTEKKIDAMASELGVGSQNGQTMSSLLQSISLSVQCMGETTDQNHKGITEILRVQEVHGNKLDIHERRISEGATKHEALAEQVALQRSTADIAHKLATTNATIAEKLVEKTALIAADLERENAKLRGRRKAVAR